MEPGVYNLFIHAFVVGQITIPIDIRKKLGVQEGDNIVFFEDQGRIVVANVAKIAFANMRQSFAGEAKRLGQNGEQDVVALVDEVRKEMWEERYANNN